MADSTSWNFVASRDPSRDNPSNEVAFGRAQSNLRGTGNLWANMGLLPCYLFVVGKAVNLPDEVRVF